MSLFNTRRRLMLAAAGAAVLPGCGWPRFFDIGWTEPVQLHDGAVVDVTVKYTYQRMDSPVRLSRYGGFTMLRNTEFSFDAGPGIGRFTQLFKQHRVDMLERFNGKWYLLLKTRGAPIIFQTLAGQKEDWGSAENGSGQKCWSLDVNGLARASINHLPDALLKVNLLLDYASPKELAVLNGTRLTAIQKKHLFYKDMWNPNDERIERPQFSNLVPPPNPAL